VTGVDLSSAMLAIARTKPILRHAAPIHYVKAPAGRMPVAEGEFDVAICQHGLQFFPDRAAALVEMRRSLRPGGRVGIAVWADIEQSPAFAALAGAIREVAGNELADSYRDGPWGMPDADQLRNLLEESGFADVRVTQDVLPLRFESAAQLGSTLAVSAIASDLDALSVRGREELARALERGVAIDDPLHAEAVAHLAVARR
jgi:ubiquinone/menaquinone biosynthesis C-methylase UbiE